MSNKSSLIGQKFGRLTVVEQLPSSKNRHTRWKCICDCGTEKEVAATKLRSGNTLSCGCYRLESLTKHGKSKHRHRLYVIWGNMKQRCGNPNHTNYSRYGGRGIKVCNEWRESFQAFYDWAVANGYQDNLQIDRIDNDGNYEPSNCRWVTGKQNSRNTSSNVRIAYDGKELTASEWSKITGISTSVISKRRQAGKPPEEILKL